MSKYQELREAFAGYYNAYRGYYATNEQLVSAVVDGLPAFLGIAPYFRNAKGKKKRYITYYQVDSEDIEVRELVEHPRDAISYGANSEFVFGIGVVLEREPDSRQKTNAIMRLHCTRDGDEMTVLLDKDEVTSRFDGKLWSGVEDIHQMIYKHLQRWLQRRPEAESDDIKIGFQVDGRSRNGVPLTEDRR